MRGSSWNTKLDVRIRADLGRKLYIPEFNAVAVRRPVYLYDMFLKAYRARCQSMFGRFLYRVSKVRVWSRRARKHKP